MEKKVQIMVLLGVEDYRITLRLDASSPQGLQV